MRRRVFTLCSAVSLLLCAAASIVWVRSYRVETYLYRDTGGGGVFCNDWYVIAGARLHWTHREGFFPDEPDSPPYARNEWKQRPARPVDFENWGYGFGRRTDGGFRALGLEYARIVDGGPITVWRRGIWVPLSWIVAVSAVLPAAWLRSRLRARRIAREGLCPACGYDLRATPTRCPECGAAATPAAHA